MPPPHDGLFFAEPRLIIVRGYLATTRAYCAQLKQAPPGLSTDLRGGSTVLPIQLCLLTSTRRSAKSKAQDEDGDDATQTAGGRLEMDLEPFTRHALSGHAVQSAPRHGWAGPRDSALERWIQNHATGKGVRLQGAVIGMLTERIGPDLRRIDNELDKLALYAGDRPITEADVRLMVADMGEEAIWGLTDGLSERNSAKAFRTLSRTLGG